MFVLIKITGGLEPIPAGSGREAEYTLDKSQHNFMYDEIYCWHY